MSRFDRYFPRFMYTFYVVAAVTYLLLGMWPFAVFYAILIFVFWWICNRWPL